MAGSYLANASRGLNLFGSIAVGGGSTVRKITAGTFTVDTSSIPLSSVETGTFTLSGATTADIVMVFASSALNAGLTLNAGAIVTATSTVTVAFVNETTAAVVQTSGLVNRFLHIKL
jgi:hypothetical protein